MRPIRGIATAMLAAGVALALAGCGGNQPDQSSAPATKPPTVSAPPTTGPPAVTAPPTTKAPVTNTPATSRRTTSSEVVLADGRYAAYITTVNPDSRKITFDVIQFYFGDDAAREAAKDGKESPPPNDYYIRNVNPKLRTLPVRADAPITVNTLAAGYTGSATRNVNVQLYRLDIMLDARGSSPPLWITVRNDQVTRIAEQYVP